MRHLTRSVDSRQNPKPVGVCGKRSTFDFEQSAECTHACDEYFGHNGRTWIRARGGQSGRTSAFEWMSCSAWTATPDLRLSEREAKLAVRRELRARKRRVRPAPPSVGDNAVRTRTAFCRPMETADCTQCDAQNMPRVHRRTPQNAASACRAAPAWRAPRCRWQ